MESPFARLASNARYICFEPDRDEAEHLQRLAPENVRYLPIALAEEERLLTLYVTRQPACSSVYPPINELYENYLDLAEIAPEKAIGTLARPLDAVLSELGEAQVDALKLDTQGSETDILKGGRKALSAALLVDIEVEFNPIYRGQNLFWEADRFLREQGFVLWRLTDLCHYAPEKLTGCSTDLRVIAAPGQHQSVSVENGQLFWGQAQYVRAELPPTSTARLDRDMATRAAALLGAFGYWDLALHALEKADAHDVLARVRQQLANPAPESPEKDSVQPIRMSS